MPAGAVGSCTKAGDTLKENRRLGLPDTEVLCPGQPGWSGGWAWDGSCVWGRGARHGVGPCPPVATTMSTSPGQEIQFFLKIAWCMQLRLNMAVSCSARWASDVDWLLAGRVCNYILTQSNRWWHVNFFKIDCTLCNHHFSWQLKFMLKVLRTYIFFFVFVYFLYLVVFIQYWFGQCVLVQKYSEWMRICVSLGFVNNSCMRKRTDGATESQTGSQRHLPAFQRT